MEGHGDTKSRDKQQPSMTYRLHIDTRQNFQTHTGSKPIEWNINWLIHNHPDFPPWNHHPKLIWESATAAGVYNLHVLSKALEIQQSIDEKDGPGWKKLKFIRAEVDNWTNMANQMLGPKSSYGRNNWYLGRFFLDDVNPIPQIRIHLTEDDYFEAKAFIGGTFSVKSKKCPWLEFEIREPPPEDDSIGFDLFLTYVQHDKLHKWAIAGVYTHKLDPFTDGIIKPGKKKLTPEQKCYNAFQMSKSSVKHKRADVLLRYAEMILFVDDVAQIEADQVNMLVKWLKHFTRADQRPLFGPIPDLPVPTGPEDLRDYDVLI